MSVGDVEVNDVAMVVDHGPFGARLGITVIGDGFTSDDLGRFREAVDEFVEFLRGIEPFASRWEAISLARVETISRESGLSTAADPRRTVFGSRRGLAPRTLEVDSSLVDDAVERHWPGSFGILLIVNAAEGRGCADPIVAVTTLQPAWLSVAVHELAHQPFELEDEYSYPRARYTGPEPSAANVTTRTQRGDIKWAHLIDAATPIPTLENPECESNDDWPSPVPEGAVGLFEGAGTHRCGIARSEHDCLMRSLSTPRFCACCSEQIASTLSGFLP